MTAHMKFFPTGNADTTFIQLANNQVVLMDYAHMRNEKDPYDKRIDLPSAIRDAMDEAGQESFRVSRTDFDLLSRHGFEVCEVTLATYAKL